MRRKTVLIFLLAFSLVLLVSCTNKEETTELENKAEESKVVEKEEPEETKEENKAPKAIDFTLKNLDGEEVSLSDYKGKKIFLNFWATWCGPCQLEMPDYEAFYNENKDDNFVILAVNVGEDESLVKNFIEENGYTMPVLFDSDKEVGKIYRVRGIPTTYSINENFEIIDMHVGALLGEDIDKAYEKFNK